MTEVRLRAIEPEDLEEIYNIENQLEMWTVGYSNAPYSRYLLHDYIANTTSDIYAERQLRLMVENEKGEIVGIADLNDFEPRHNRAEMGIVVKKDERGKGYARAMVEKLLEYARTVIHLHQVYVVISESNESALHLFREMGFYDKNVLEDWIFDGQKYRNAVFLHFFL